jgi:hypothetical protein
MTDQWSWKAENFSGEPYQSDKSVALRDGSYNKSAEERSTYPRVCPYIGLLSLDSYDISLVLITVVQIPLCTVFDLEDWTVVFRASPKCRVGYDLFTRVFWRAKSKRFCALRFYNLVHLSSETVPADGFSRSINNF